MANPASDDSRKQYGKLFDQVSALLFRHDSIGINFDTNTDEYDPEARTILPRLGRCESEADVLRVIVEEFHRWFGEDIREAQADYNQIAADIWRVYNAAK
jgi:hypothetical protein